MTFAAAAKALRIHFPPHRRYKCSDNAMHNIIIIIVVRLKRAFVRVRSVSLLR